MVDLGLSLCNTRDKDRLWHGPNLVVQGEQTPLLYMIIDKQQQQQLRAINTGKEKGRSNQSWHGVRITGLTALNLARDDPSRLRETSTDENKNKSGVNDLSARRW